MFLLITNICWSSTFLSLCLQSSNAVSRMEIFCKLAKTPSVDPYGSVNSLKDHCSSHCPHLYFPKCACDTRAILDTIEKLPFPKHRSCSSTFPSRAAFSDLFTISIASLKNEREQVYQQPKAILFLL